MSEQFLNNKSIKGRSGITAGNDVSISDVTGQLAIGEYINQVMIKEPSGEALVELMVYLEQKRKEAVNLKILNSYNSSALPYYDPTVKKFVTQNRVEDLNKALLYLQDRRILLFKGIGGIGKTTLARALVDIRPAHVPFPFWFDFRQNADAKLGDILEKFAAYINSPDLAKFREEKRDAGTKDINKLTDKLNEKNPIWLVFDNIETVLDDIYFHDEYLDLFFTSLHNNTHQAKIIITSRVSPKLKNGEDLIDIIEEEKQDVKGLKTNFAVDYLVKNGLGNLEPNKLEELAKGVDGHPLALQLLVGLVKDFGEADILENLSMYKEQREDTILKARKLFDKLAGDEKELLERISVYREPVGIKGIKEMFKEKKSLKNIKKLTDKSLLETDHKSKYWLHPLVQEFSYDDLKNKQEVHLIAHNYYVSLSLPENPTRKEDLRPAIEAHYHACEAKEYELAAWIIYNSNLHSYLEIWGDYTTLIILYMRLLPPDPLNNKVHLSNEMKSFVFGDLGINYQQLGYVRKAIEYYEQALKIARETGDRQGEGTWLGNLGNAHNDMGELKKAIEYYEQALKITREIGGRQGEGTALGNLGNAYNSLGDAKKAIDYFEQALKIAREIGDRRAEGTDLGNIGLAYWYLGETKKAIEYNEQALKIAREINARCEEETALGNLGLTYRDLGQTKKAIEYHEQALKITREIGNRCKEGNTLGSLGNAYYSLGSAKKAIEYHEQALKIAREIGDKLGEGAWLGNMGLAYWYLGETKKAIDYFEQALKIAREIGDKRGEGAWLGNMGLAYRDLGETKKAIDYFEQALKIAREIGDKRGEGAWLGNMGLAYRDLGETKKAIDFLKESFAIGKSIEDPKMIKCFEEELKKLKGFNEYNDLKKLSGIKRYISTLLFKK
jgi:tetratricopeptide (TPR) repeat protein